MDPNAALANARAAIPVIEERPKGDWLGAVDDLVNAFEALDEWLSRDGFLPDDWRSDDEKEAARLKVEWDEAFAALKAAGLEANADHPIAVRYRAASDAVNHANRKIEAQRLNGR